jgi:hypothetical protein
MKTLSRRLTQFGLAVVIGLIGAGLACAEEKVPTKNVVISKDRIIIPGTEMSKADGQAMNKILKQFDKSLYKIETYENGELKKTRGELTDVVTDKELASQIAANVKKKGFTQYAVQVAGQVEGGPSPSPGGGGVNPAVANPPPAPPPPKAWQEGGPSPSPGGGSGANPAVANPPPAPPPPKAWQEGGPSPSPGGGSGANPAHPNPPPPPPSLRGARGQKESEELIQRLKPILEKYSKK